MNKLVCILLLLFVVVAACTYTPPIEKNSEMSQFNNVSKFEYSGHTYIAFRQIETISNTQVLHDPDCQCHKKID